MYDQDILNEINRLNFEDFLLLVFIVLSIINIYGDYNEKEFIKTSDRKYKNKANVIFEITLFVTLFIYLYFFIRNYNAYQKAEEKDKKLFIIKLMGSGLLIAGIICLIYFQDKQTSFTGTPAL